MKYLQLLRPKQWLKNIYVLIPIFFSEDIGFEQVMIALKMFLLFILASSCVYIINDIKDIEYDKKHPSKRHRPIAQGDITINNALILLGLLFIFLLFLINFLNITSLGTGLIALYLSFNLLYSFGLKNIPLLELAILTSGFVIRLLAGSLETLIPLSPWIMMCAGLVSLMLAVGKRRNELKYLSDINVLSRVSLKGYNSEFLDQVNSILASITIVSYLLYCVSLYSLSSAGPHILWTSPVVVFSIIRYLQLVSIESKGEDPTAMLIDDNVSIGLLLLWFVLITIVMYF